MCVLFLRSQRNAVSDVSLSRQQENWLNKYVLKIFFPRRQFDQTLAFTVGVDKGFTSTNHNG